MAVTLRREHPIVWLRELLMFGKREKKHRPLSTSCVLTNDDPVLENQPLMWLRVEVVNAEIEENLELAGVQIHSDNVVAAGDSQHVGNELGCDGRAGLSFLSMRA